MVDGFFCPHPEYMLLMGTSTNSYGDETKGIWCKKEKETIQMLVTNGKRGRDMQICNLIMKSLKDLFINDLEEVSKEDQDDIKRIFEGNAIYNIINNKK